MYLEEKNTCVEKCCWIFAATGLLIGAKKNPLIAHSEGAIIAEGNRIGLCHYPAQKGLALLLSWTSPRLQQNNVNLWRTQGGLERARGAVVTQVIHLS